MKPKTRLFLYHLLWAVDAIARPGYESMIGNLPAKASERGLIRKMQELENQGLIESTRSRYNEKRFVRLTEAGRIAALGGRDPEIAWSRSWDRIWRLILFDIPKREAVLRKRVNRALKAFHCGHLQGSVWILPSTPAGLRKVFSERGSDCSHLLILDAAVKSRELNQRLVRTAWDFSKINELYKKDIQILKALPKGTEARPDTILEWSKKENEAWLDAVENDPLLPKILHPRGYLGSKAWKLRRKTLLEARTELSRIQE